MNVWSIWCQNVLKNWNKIKFETCEYLKKTLFFNKCLTQKRSETIKQVLCFPFYLPMTAVAEKYMLSSYAERVIKKQRWWHTRKGEGQSNDKPWGSATVPPCRLRIDFMFSSKLRGSVGQVSQAHSRWNSLVLISNNFARTGLSTPWQPCLLHQFTWLRIHTNILHW